MTGTTDEAAPAPSPVRFRVLGPLEVDSPAGAVRVPPGRQQVVAAALVLDYDRPVSTDYLVQAVWSEDPPRTARTQVQICVSRLRTSLAPTGAVIATLPSGYALQGPRGAVDVERYHDGVRRASGLIAQGRDEQAAAELRAAVDLWRGPALSGIDSKLLRAQATRLDAHRLTTVEQSAEVGLRLGRHTQLVAELTALVDQHPWRERLRAQLMTALYRSGRQAEALGVYRAGRRILAEDLGLDPGEELRELEQAILTKDPSLWRGVRDAPTAAEPVPPSPSPSGPSVPAVFLPGPSVPGPSVPGSSVPAPYLPTPSVPAPAFQAPAAPAPPPAAPSVPSSRDVPQPGPAPPATSTPPPPAGPTAHEPLVPAVSPYQLPTAAADFVGRTGLLRAVEDAVVGDPDRVGIAVLLGRPGVGKSTTALHVAHALGREHFRDGQLYCDLRATRSDPLQPTDVLGRFLRTLSVPAQAIPADADERAGMFRGLLARKRVLLVLDDAASESQILPLVPGDPACGVIVTSRARLTGLPGSTTLEVAVFSEHTSLELLTRVLGQQRVMAEPDAALALVEAVGRLPLALRIVAARLAAKPHWSLADMVTRLADESQRLDELSHGEMTVRASLSLTCDGLTACAARAFELLGLVRGSSIPAWAVGALLDDARPLPSDLVESLVDAHLLDVVPGPGGELAYRFHDLVRDYSRERAASRLEAPARRAAVERLAGGWLALLDEANRRLFGDTVTRMPGPAPRWHPPPERVRGSLTDPRAWFEQERSNLQHAVDSCAEQGLHTQCWELVVQSSTFLRQHGHHDVLAGMHEQAVRATSSSGDQLGAAAVARLDVAAPADRLPGA